MTQENETTTEFLELLNHYPSPHNGQPIIMRQNTDEEFKLYFQKERGLQSAEISFIFSFVSMGVFMQHMEFCAQALGHTVNATLSLPKVDELPGSGHIKFGSCRVKWNERTPDTSLKETLLNRQTSRKKYFQGIPADLSQRLEQIAADDGMLLRQLTPDRAREAIWLNQRAVFDDMFDEPVRKELDHWLRYDQQQKQATQDGLAYDCMELNGTLLKYVVSHPRVLRLPGLSWLMQRYYLHTMTDSSSVFCMFAPFKTEQQSFDIGCNIMKLWLACAKDGNYIHPFGTIVSNQKAHQDFLKLIDVQNESRDKSYLVFIFRAGKSEKPIPSLRLSVKGHLLQE